MSAKAATVLAYHGFDHSGLPTSITPEAFEAQLKFLTENHYNVVSLDELAGYIDRREPMPPKTVAVTIDDGWRNAVKGAALLRKYDLPFTLFLPMQYIGNPRSKRTLGLNDIQTIASDPKAAFADHSYSHGRGLTPRRIADTAADRRRLREDIARSRARYKEVFGEETPYFAFPFGRSDPVYAEELAAAGFKYLFVVGGRSFDETVDKLAVPRLGGHALSIEQLKKLLR